MTGGLGDLTYRWQPPLPVAYTATCLCGRELPLREVSQGYATWWTYTDSRNCPGCGQYHSVPARLGGGKDVG
jgi:hypothetical protein